jgi:hypothetical protein
VHTWVWDCERTEDVPEVLLTIVYGMKETHTAPCRWTTKGKTKEHENSVLRQDSEIFQEGHRGRAAHVQRSRIQPRVCVSQAVGEQGTMHTQRDPHSQARLCTPWELLLHQSSSWAGWNLGPGSHRNGPTLYSEVGGPGSKNNSHAIYSPRVCHTLSQVLFVEKFSKYWNNPL